ncbi:hypothetical protein LJC35_07640 [Parabacteroides sp. OttesenSCG-928-N08]|nr:hypothetical protein [Parabacteroides sp. OttesenSCG-928-N08]
MYMKPLTTPYILLTLLLLSSCAKSGSGNVSQAMAFLEERPDSAYILLKEVEYNRLSDEKEKADYILAHALANLRMGRSLVTDTLLPQAMRFYNITGDTAAYIKASVAQGHHLRALERKGEAFELIDSLSSVMPKEQQKILNQELLGFTFLDNDFDRSLSIIERQIELSSNEEDRFDFEIKKITPLIVLGSSTDAVALCDSLFALPSAPEIGSNEWIYMRINYAAALGERRETAPDAIAVFEEVFELLGDAPAESLLDMYIPMVNLQLNAGNIEGANRYLALIDKSDGEILLKDPVAASYLDFLKIVLGYERSGVLSLSRLSNVAHSLRSVNNDLEMKRGERDDALEAAYDLSRNNYRLTIKQQRMWLIIILVVLGASVALVSFALLLQRRRRRLIDAEERIETLEELLKAVNNPATDEKQGLLKRLLLQQLGIIKSFAESPTSQNQDALRKISNIGYSDTPIDALVRWEDLYPVIDELFDNIHQRLLNEYPNLFSEREIQIISLIRAGFSTKEIGVLLQQTSNSIYVSKTAIRKKLGLLPKEDIMDCLTARLNSPEER